MTFKILSALLASCALLYSHLALASITYIYSGNKFDEAYAHVPGPQDSNADAVITQQIWELRQQQLDFKLDTPVALPAGWSSFDQRGIYGELAGALIADGTDSISWNLIHPELGMSGYATLGSTPPSAPVTNGGVYVSIHVNMQQIIDAWEISYAYYYDYGQPTWAMYESQSLRISSNTGDEVSFATGDQDRSAWRSGYNRTPGVWSVVPEPTTSAMLLSGLGALVWLRRRAT